MQIWYELINKIKNQERGKKLAKQTFIVLDIIIVTIGTVSVIARAADFDESSEVESTYNIIMIVVAGFSTFVAVLFIIIGSVLLYRLRKY